MKKYTVWLSIASIIISIYSIQANAEARRDDGGGQANKKAQYMIRQLHNEKQELQAKFAELQAKFDTLTKEHEKIKASLDKSSANNDKLVSRVKNDVNKYNELAEKYREVISILKKSNLDNQYMVRAVQEREEWIAGCADRNDNLFQANSDLLNKYGEAAGSGAEPFTGISTVEIENEMQDYRFKLEDLQVTQFKPVIDTASHSRKINEEAAAEVNKKSTDVN